MTIPIGSAQPVIVACQSEYSPSACRLGQSGDDIQPHLLSLISTIKTTYQSKISLPLFKMMSRNFTPIGKSSRFLRTSHVRFQANAISSSTRFQSPTDTKHISQEPLAQQLNIDDPESGDLRAKAQAAQSRSENVTDPPAAESSGPASQATQEPEAQRQDKDEPPAGGLRAKTHDAEARSENSIER